MIRRVVVLLLLPLLPAVVLGVVVPQASTSSRSPANSLHWPLTKILEHHDILWIDARPYAQYQAGHMPGALPLAPEDWDTHLPAILEHWTPEKLLVVYCSSDQCDTSQIIAQRLIEELELKNTVILQNGYPRLPEVAPGTPGSPESKPRQ